jgi:hypothetical protein
MKLTLRPGDAAQRADEQRDDSARDGWSVALLGTATFVITAAIMT